ncbi:uncharacterized protein LOC110663240 [Hevea brasiliensis]|uniref:uncharacterized protein LOC110663240 n=1 Tax=Hevea brasiliensis TaxID=3981 RepID=UPI0025F926F4|nr:uncharacterized protein LOC110663240 [Hevea brasiliensis]
MPSYAKFLKEILSNKRKLEDYETVALTEECSTILQNKLSPKLKDPESFSIPYFTGNMNIDKAFCDLGASVSLMPHNMPKVNVEELTNNYLTTIEMEEDVQILIILGRPFLATTRVIIDVKNGQLTLKLREEEVEFNLFRVMIHKSKSDKCLRVNIIDKLVEEIFQKRYPEDPLKACIVHSNTVDNENKEIVAFVRSLEASPPLLLTQALQVEELKEEQPKSQPLEDT